MGVVNQVESIPVDPWPAILECEGWTYRLGSRDCCTFIAHVLKRPELLDVFPRYRHPAQAERIIADNGGWAGMFSAVLQPIPVLQACRGDVVLMDDEPGICVGTAAAVFTVDGGVAYRPMSLVTGAWRG